MCARYSGEGQSRVSGACVGHTDARRARHTAMAEPGRVLAFLCAARRVRRNGAKRAIGAQIRRMGRAVRVP
eukprot:1906602-Prymnesium_polylepis.1